MAKRRKRTSKRRASHSVPLDTWIQAVRKESSGVPLVRTSDAMILSWNRQRIAEALVRETMLCQELFGIPSMPIEEAEQIAAEVEQQIQQMQLPFISAPLIREVQNQVLLEKAKTSPKYAVYRNALTRVGMPLWDFSRIIGGGGYEARENANMQANPETLHKKIADKLCKEAYLLMLPPEIADAHLVGDIHIHDLEYFGTRPFCADYDARYFFKYGLMCDGTGERTAVAKPASHATVAVLHLIKVLAAGQTNCAGGQGLFNFNVFMAPYLRGLSEREIKQVAQTILFEANETYVSRGGQLVFSSIQLEAGIPKIWQDAPVVYRGKVGPDTYGDYADEARIFMESILEQYCQGDAMGKMFSFPKPEVRLRRDYLTKSEYEKAMFLAAKLSAKFGSSYFDNVIPPWRGEEGVDCYQCLPADEKVFVKDDGTVRLGEIGPLIEGIKGERLNIDDAEWWSVNREIEVPSFDEEGKVRYSRVLRVMRKKSTGALIKIKLKGGLQARVTPDHPVITSSGVKPAHTLKLDDYIPVPRKIPHQVSVKKIDVINVLKGCNLRVRGIDFLDIGLTPTKLSKITGAPVSRCKNWTRYGSIPVEEFLKIKVPGDEFLVGVTHAKTGLIPTKIKLDEKFGQIIGYYLAEGDDFTGRGLRFSFGVHERNHIDELIGLLRDVFGEYITISTHTQSYGRYNHTTINVPCIILSKLFEKLGIGRTARKKQVPPIAFNAPKEFQIGLLKGMIKGDGSWDFSRAPYFKIHLTKNERLITGIRSLLLMFGVFSTIHRRPESIELRISSVTHANNLTTLVEVGDKMQKTARTSIDMIRAFNDVSWLRVKSIEVIPYDDYVYDWEVEGTHNFLHGDGLFSRNCCAFRLTEDLDDDELMRKVMFEEGAHFSMGGLQVVSINLPRLAYISKGDDAALLEHLRNAMERAKQVLELKQQFVGRQMQNGMLPFLMQQPRSNGGKAPMLFDITKMSPVIGFVGANEMVQHHLGLQLHESRDAVRFGLRVLAEMERIRGDFSAQTGLPFAVARTPAESCSTRLAILDLLHHNDQAVTTVKGDITDWRQRLETGGRTQVPVYYTNGFMLHYDAQVSLAEKIRIEEKAFPLLSGGNIFHVFLGEAAPDAEALAKLNARIALNSQLGYYSYTRDLSVCKNCHTTTGGLLEVCPLCGSGSLNWFSRITGYYQNVEGWNEGKRKELQLRHRHVGSSLSSMVTPYKTSVVESKHISETDSVQAP